MATVALVMRSESRHRALYLEALRDLPSVSEVVIADPEGGTFDEARQTVHNKPMRTYTSLDAMLQAESPAMAIVTFSAVESPRMIRPVLEAGIPVLTQKPACVRLEDFARLVDLAERRNTHLMPALSGRMAPLAADARRILQQGSLGKLYAVRAMYLADQTRIWDPQRRDWSFRKAEAAGGHLAWLGIHWIDLMHHLTGDRIVEVQALTANVGGGPIDVEDLALVNFRFAGGAYGSLTSGYLLDTDYQIDMAFWGAEGWLRFDWQAGLLDCHLAGVDPEESPDRHVRYGPFTGGYTPFVRNCLRASLGEIPPPIRAEEGLAALRVVFAAYQSAETGQTVEV